MPRIKVKNLQVGDIFAFLHIDGGPDSCWSRVQEIAVWPARLSGLKLIYTNPHIMNPPGVVYISPYDYVWKDNRRTIE